MAVVNKLIRRLDRSFGGLQYRQKLRVTIVLLAFVPLLLLSAVYLFAYAQTKLTAILDRDAAGFANEVENLDKMYYAGIKKSVYITNNLQVIQLLKQNYDDDLLAYITNLANVQGVLEALKSDELQSGVAVFGFNPSLYRTDTIKKIGDLDPLTRERVLRNNDDYPVRHFAPSPVNGRMEARIYSKIMDLSETLAITEVTFPLDESFRAIRELLPAGSFILYRAKDGAQFAIGSNGVGAEEAERAAAAYERQAAAPSYYVMPLHIDAAQDDLLLFVGRASVFLKLAGKLAWPLVMLCGLVLTIFFSIKLAATLLTRRLTVLMGVVKSELGTLAPLGPHPAAARQDEPGPSDGRDPTEGRDIPGAGACGPAADVAEPSSLDGRSPDAGRDELSQLDRAFHGLVAQIRDHYRQTAEYEVSRRLLETELLQVNINPHVLYNTLSAIKWVYDDERLARLVDDMVDFYRLLLNRGEPVAPLAQEIEMVKKYVEMHKFSYEADFTCEVDMDETLGEATLLRSTLQPIVENGLVHGISMLAEGGRIGISARRDGELAVIEVTDNGRGMELPLAERLLAADASASPRAGKPAGSGYALSNIQRRIKLYYGDAYGMRIESAPGAGTKVTLTIPLDRKQNTVP